MPIHIPTPSRRQFLCQSLGAGASLLAFNYSQASERSVDANRIFLLADTHIPADKTKETRKQLTAENLARVVRDILAAPQIPAAVIINGDCACIKGLQKEYELLSELLAPLSAANIPIHLTMGNHDDRVVFREVLQNKVKIDSPLEEKHVVLLQTPAANWFLIDTLLEVNVVTGEVGSQQLEWLEKALDAHADRPAIVVGHHNPQFFILPGIRASGIKDTSALFDLLNKKKQVKAYFYGHSHTWRKSQPKSGIHLVNQPPVGYVFDDKNPMGWLNAVTSPQGISMEFTAKNKSHSVHGSTTKLTWRT